MRERAMQRGQVWKKPNGLYAIRWYDAAGNRHQETVGKLKQDAVDLLDDRIRRARMGQLYRTRKDITLAELVERFMAQYQRPLQTRKRITTELNRATKAFGDVPLLQLDPAEISIWISNLPVEQTTRSITIRALRQVLRKGVAWGYIDKNPAAPDLVEVPEGHVKEINPFETWDVADAIGSHYGPLVSFAVATGLRPEEWSALEWRDIDLAGRCLHVRRTWTRIGGARDVGKTKAARRQVDLQQRAVDALAAVPRTLHEPRVFSTRSRRRTVDVTYWAKAWFYPAVALAGLERRTPYAMRHTFAAFSLAAGCDLHWLKDQMGHETIAVTSDRYGHLVKRARNDALARLDAWSAGGVGHATGTGHR
jgi:integrase